MQNHNTPGTPEKLVMQNTSELKLNQFERPSPHKRRKLDFLKQKSKIPMRYSKNDHLYSLQRAADRKEDDISRINMEIMTLKTKKHHFEFEGYNLEQEHSKLKGELDLISGQIDELKQFEQQSLKDLEAKYDLTMRKLSLEQDQCLEAEKEDVSKQIEEIIGSIQQEHIDKRTQLAKECDELRQKVKNHKHEVEEAIETAKNEQIQKNSLVEQQNAETLAKIKRDLESLDAEIVNQQRKNAESEKQLLDKVSVNRDLTSKRDLVKSHFESKESEITAINDKVEALELSITSLENSITSKTNEINSKLEQIMDMKSSLLNMEHNRRVLHNRLQELKGNIRVYCRVRAPSPNAELVPIDYPADDNDVDDQLNQSITISKSLLDTIQGQSRTSSYSFKFDKVFGPNHNNLEIFSELSQLVQSALDGYNVCVFAYGQTGSGKTFTMSHAEDGMIPLTINKIFGDIEDLKQSGWAYEVDGQCLEIYNETIIDLLGSGNDTVKYEIKHDDVNNRTTVSNLRSKRLSSVEDALSLFNRSSLNRSTASTASNERSSRSHSIFILNIKGTNSKTGHSCEGCLNLVDLAGSERLNHSQAKGDRLKETQYINKSLSCLGDVIYSLGQASKNNNQHIPYRNSKLTYLLKNSLGGDSKTLMFVNISPSKENFNESLNSFRFATKVSKTQQRK